MARLILTTPGEDVDVGGTVDVVGTTSGGEVITITGGTITLDASFNAGGDTIVLPGSAGTYTVQLAGSRAIIASSTVTVSIPLGISGTAIQFSDATLTLEIDSGTGTAQLGEQSLTNTAQPVEVPPPESLYGTNVIFEVEPNDDLATDDQIDRSLLTSSPNDPNLTDPSAPSVELRGVIDPTDDYDLFAIYLNAGETITLDVDGAYDPNDVSGLDTYIALADSEGFFIAENDDGETLDEGSTSEFDSYLTFEVSESGYYYIYIQRIEPNADLPQHYHLLVSVDEAAQQQAIGGAKDFHAQGLEEAMLSSLQMMSFA